MINKLDMALSFHQKALSVRAERQELIAANIANADTPHFKARDIDFKTAMQSATDGLNNRAFQTSKTNNQHFDGVNAQNNGTSQGVALFRPIVQGSVDGNTVDMDVERNQFADNAIRYEASLTMLNGQLKKILAALQSS
jgi:flagellar basal-body rod protein FlgB